MDSVPEVDRCQCEPKVKKQGKMYPLKAERADLKTTRKWEDGTSSETDLEIYDDVVGVEDAVPCLTEIPFAHFIALVCDCFFTTHKLFTELKAREIAAYGAAKAGC